MEFFLNREPHGTSRPSYLVPWTGMQDLKSKTRTKHTHRRHKHMQRHGRTNDHTGIRRSGPMKVMLIPSSRRRKSSRQTRTAAPAVALINMVSKA